MQYLRLLVLGNQQILRRPTPPNNILPGLVFVQCWRSQPSESGLCCHRLLHGSGSLNRTHQVELVYNYQTDADSTDIVATKELHLLNLPIPIIMPWHCQFILVQRAFVHDGGSITFVASPYRSSLLSSPSSILSTATLRYPRLRTFSSYNCRPFALSPFLTSSLVRNSAYTRTASSQLQPET